MAAARLPPTPGEARPDEADRSPRHSVAHPQEWPWLPRQESGTLAQHPYCARCGLVRFVGSERALDLGGLANLLARLEHQLGQQGRRVTEAQRRLIVKQLERQDAVDTFGLSRASQYGLVAEAVAKYTGLPRDVVLSYLCNC